MRWSRGYGVIPVAVRWRGARHRGARSRAIGVPPAPTRATPGGTTVRGWRGVAYGAKGTCRGCRPAAAGPSTPGIPLSDRAAPVRGGIPPARPDPRRNRRREVRTPHPRGPPQVPRVPATQPHRTTAATRREPVEPRTRPSMQTGTAGGKSNAGAAPQLRRHLCRPPHPRPHGVSWVDVPARTALPGLGSPLSAPASLPRTTPVWPLSPSRRRRGGAGPPEEGP
ncbi:hypothetical protein STVIR_7166 [Streptomyces viridochromogenes Tue57]|uniref:Uncharacterized protein n=1 Tax=Streptomyces viridochromogenes Tue57 TaxID=1160705 RepID=L8P925_STRVR|nr:hypothetical protein STVIR_7166 [Streptomyces viridochromogenes Tue57]